MSPRVTFIALILSLSASGSLRAVSPADEAKAIIEELVACGTRQSLSSWTDPKRGAGCGRSAVARRFEEIAKGSGGRLKVVVDKFEASGPRTKNAPVPMENVYAILMGADASLSKTAVVISGHLDSMCSDVMDSTCDAPGADDDASGVAVSILSAKALAKTPARATLIFAAVAGEEQGLLGSKRMLEWLMKEGYVVGGMITCDIVGATNGSSDRRVRVFSEGGSDGIESPGRQMARLVEDVNGKDKVRLIFRLDRFGRGGDHRPFTEAGLPAVRFTEPLEDYRHQHQTPRTENGVEYGDLIKYLDFPFIADVSIAVQKTLSEMGNAPSPPRRATLGGAVTPSAEILLEGHKDFERASYEILWRETTEARWSVVHTLDANAAAALPPAAGTPKAESGAAAAPSPPFEENLSSVLSSVSTDNHYFAVRSLGKNGRRSIAVPCAAAVRRPPGYVPADAPKATPPAPAPEKKP